MRNYFLFSMETEVQSEIIQKYRFPDPEGRLPSERINAEELKKSFKEKGFRFIMFRSTSWTLLFT